MRSKRLGATTISILAFLLLIVAGSFGCSGGPGGRIHAPAIPAANDIIAPDAGDVAAAPDVKTPTGPFPILSPSQMYNRLHGVRLVLSNPHSGETIMGKSPAPTKSASSIMTRTGDEFEADLSQRVSSAGTEARFDSAWVDGSSDFDTVSYATYRFDLNARLGRLSIRTAWTRPVGTPPLDYSRIWLGASDWQNNRWDWYSGAASGAALTTAEGIDLYRHPQTEEMLVIVVQLAKSASWLNRVWLSGYSLRGDWWMYGRNATHAASSPFHGPDSPTELWRQRLGTGVLPQQPVYDADGNLYFGTGINGAATRSLTSFDSSGVQKWTQPLTALDEADPGWPSPALGYDGGVYYALHHGPLYVKYLDGSAGWEFTGYKCVEGSPALGADGIAYVIGIGGDSYTESYLHALDSHGIQTWEYAFGEYPVTSPVIGPDGTIYVGCADMSVYAFLPDGAVKWSYMADAAINAGLATGSDGTVYFEDANAKLYAVDADGALVWAYQLPGSAGSGAPGAAISADGAICVTATDERLYVLNADGSFNWSFGVGPCLAAPAIDVAGNIFISSMDCRLYAFNPDGTLKWWFVADAPLRTQPVIAENGTLYVNDALGTMYAIGPGQEMEQYTISGFVKDEGAVGLAGVTITITGAESVVTDASGYWSKSGLPDGDYLVSPTLDDYAFSPLFDIATISGGDVVVADFTGSLSNTPVWPQWGLDRAHTRRSPHVGPDATLARWGHQFTDESVISQPVIGGDGTIYIQFTNGMLRAFNPDGQERWHYALWSASNASPALGIDGTVYSSSVDGLIYAFTPGGAYQWTRLLVDGLSGSPVVAADGVILHNSSAGGIIALNPDGTDKWQYSAGSGLGCEATPAMADDGTIYCGNGVDKIFALNSDGSEKWVFAADPGAVTESSQTSPAVGDDGTVYMGFGRNFYALNPDGTQQWVFPMEVDLHSSPAIGADGTVFFGSSFNVGLRGARFIALNPDGTLKWEYTSKVGILSSPAVDGSGTIYAGVKVTESSGGALSAFNPDGTVKWSKNTLGNILSSPAIGADGTLYFGDDQGTVYSIGPGAG